MVFETLTMRTEGSVLFAEIAAPPMNLLGPELVRDLVSLIQQAEADDAFRVLGTIAATPTTPFPTSTPPGSPEYRAEAAKPTGEASIALLFRHLSASRLVTIAQIKVATPPAGSEFVLACDIRRLAARNPRPPAQSAASVGCGPWRGRRPTPHAALMGRPRAPGGHAERGGLRRGKPVSTMLDQPSVVGRQPWAISSDCPAHASPDFRPLAMPVVKEQYVTVPRP